MRLKENQRSFKFCELPEGSTEETGLQGNVQE